MKKDKEMTISKKRLYILVIGIVVGLAIIAGTTTAIVVTRPNTSAYNGTESSVSIGNLLTDDGTGINATTRTALLSAVGGIGTVSGQQKASAINGGQPVIFQMGEINGNPIYWQVVYRTKDYITVWMCEPYTISVFNPDGATSDANVGYIENGNYSKSIIRDTTLVTYEAMSDSLPILKEIVVTPFEAASSWQSYQTNSKYSSYTSLTNGLGTQNSTTNPYNWAWVSCMADKFWIPSYYEVFSTSTSSADDGGLWGLNSTMRGFNGTALDGSGSTTYCWLRSGSL